MYARLASTHGSPISLTGAVESGSMTLVIAPPGHGKTTFLRALAGSLDVPKMTQTGSVLLNGASYSESDLHLSQTIATVSQRDLHLPLLTVRETLEFAYANGNVDESLLAGHADVIAQVRFCCIEIQSVSTVNCHYASLKLGRF